MDGYPPSAVTFAWWLAALGVPLMAWMGHRCVDRLRVPSAGSAPGVGANFERERDALHLAVLGTAVSWVPCVRDHELVLQSLFGGLVGAACMVALSRALGRGPSARLDAAVRAVRVARVRVLRMPGWAFAAAVFVLEVVLAAGCSWLLFRGLPVIQDSQAQLFHARILASGHAVAPAPALPEFFEADHVIVRGGFYSQYPPGHTVMLMLGVLAGVPWLVNPVLGGAALVFLYLAGRVGFGERTGRVAALLGLASPFVLFMSSEAMNHATALALFAAQLAATVRALAAPDARRATGWAVLAGVAQGWLLLVRPITAVGLGLPLAVLVVHRTIRAPRRLAIAACAMALTALGVGSLLLLWNVATTGDPFLMGYVVRWGPAHTLGWVSPWGAPHTPADGLEHTFSNLDAWNVHLLGVAVPGVLPVLLGLVRDRHRALAWALFAAPVMVLLIYFFYFFQDLTFGPRFLYEASGAAFLLAARGLGGLPRWARMRGATSRRAVARGLVTASTVCAIGVGGVTSSVWLGLEYARGYGLHGAIVEPAEAALPHGRALVFVEGAYQRAFYAVDPWLSGRVLFARDLGVARDCELARSMPERAAWVERAHRLWPLDRDRCTLGTSSRGP